MNSIYGKFSMTSTTQSSTTEKFRVRAKMCVVGLYVLAIVAGVLQIYFWREPRVPVVLSIIFATLATSWVSNDMRAREKTFLRVLQILFFFVWPLGAVVYLTTKTGVSGFLIAIANGIALYLLYAFSYNLTIYVLHSCGILDQAFYSK
jgi:hypothetical protein